MIPSLMDPEAVLVFEDLAAKRTNDLDRTVDAFEMKRQVRYLDAFVTHRARGRRSRRVRFRVPLHDKA